jgi:hypothetical protein
MRDFSSKAHGPKTAQSNEREISINTSPRYRSLSEAKPIQRFVKQ